MIHVSLSLHDRPHVPMELTSFVGRMRDTTGIADLLRQARLVTIVGPGGVGKSRLAMRVADSLADHFAHGLHVIDMAAFGARGTSVPKLAASDHDNAAMVLLDNCGHVTTLCREFALQLLACAPDMHLLVTSRAPLGVRGERQWRLRPLGIPPLGANVDEIQASEAVQLFLERLATQQAGFRLTSENAALVAELCRNLDGLPLALELAAAHVALLGLEVLSSSSGITELIRLTSTSGRPLRQVSLQSSFEWSQACLAPDDQALLARLTIFADGFTLESARAVCAASGGEPMALIDALERLVNASCVQFEPAGSADRYRMLETVRRAAARGLAAGERDRLRERLVTWLEDVAVRTDGWSIDPSALDILAAEIGNLRSFFTETDIANREQRLRALRLFVLCTPLWARGFPGEGAQELARLWRPSLTSGDPVLDAHAGWLSGMFAYYAGDISHAIREITQAMPVLQAHGYDRAVVTAGYFLAENYLQEGETLAAAQVLADVCEESRRRGHTLTPGVRACLVLTSLGCGDLDTARSHAMQSLQEAQLSGNPWSLTRAWAAAAAVALREGDFDEAIRAQVHAVAEAHRCSPQHAWIQPSLELAEMYLTNGDRRPAASVLLEVFMRATSNASLPVPYVRRLISLTGRVVEPVRSEHAQNFGRAVAHQLSLTEWSNSTELWWLCAHASTALRSVLGRSPSTHSTPVLTAREHEIAGWMERGLTNREIGLQLRLSEGTVRTHVGHILDKLDLRSRVQVGPALAVQVTASRPD